MVKLTEAKDAICPSRFNLGQESIQMIMGQPRIKMIDNSVCSVLLVQECILRGTFDFAFDWITAKSLMHMQYVHCMIGLLQLSRSLTAPS